MPTRRNPKKSRTAEAAPSVEDLTPANLDQVVVLPAVPPLPIAGAEPQVRPAPPKAGPPITYGRSAAGRGSQRAGQPRRYAFRRS
ncbi:hypothetical protein O7614_26265 [Micromonospora sp. WMMD961]|uniref:hypothetical protein n=1 Tax=Micromonospora sp. WMMD961 TaxID=3016100 RepID=UPI0024180240|nr:hypothetical protein [Micromonospora sp. WMMD961]MDG4783169.1 hypothetical protein [Micromonospora sp. WMMD961]